MNRFASTQAKTIKKKQTTLQPTKNGFKPGYEKPRKKTINLGKAEL